MSEFSENDEQSWWQMPLRLETVNPDTLQRRPILNMRRWVIVAIVGAVVVGIIGVTYALVGFTPLRKLLPGDYSQLDVPEMVQLRSKVQEMEGVLKQQDNYIATMQGILSGKPVDSLQHEDTQLSPKTDTPIKPVDKIQEEVQLQENIEMEDRLRSLRQSIRQNGTESDGKDQLSNLMAPVIGPIGKGYDPAVSHFGIDILAPKNTAVKAIADGLVLQSDWTVETGNTILILHSAGVISVYKHNSSLLKENYQKVTQGEAIAIIGNTGTLTTGPHVHFELWVDGFPVDPATYINFQ